VTGHNSSSKKQLPVMLQFPIYAIIQLALLPVTIIGYVFSVIKVMLYSKKYGLSATSTSPLGARWILHKFGLREDEAGAKMIVSLPHISELGFFMTMIPSLIAYKISGYLPKVAQVPEPDKVTLMSFVSFRTAFFDRLMKTNIHNMAQVVFMGAGFDTRAFNYYKMKNLKVFELDKKNIQNCKIEALKKAKINYEWINYIPIDFNKESWLDKLVDNGFDTSKKTFFLWEGVTLYLEEKSVTQTLKTVAKSSGNGSIIAFDFYSKSFVANEDGSAFMRYYGKRALKVTGESMHFGIDTTTNPEENVKTLLKEAGLTLGEFVLMGKTSNKNKPLGGLVEALIQ